MMLALYSIEILEAKRMLRQRSKRIRFRFERKYSGNPEWGGWIGVIKI